MQPHAATTFALGLLAMLFFAMHAAVQWHTGHLENLLWACHVADLCVGLGLLIRHRLLAAAGVLLLTIGVPLWLINLAHGGAFYPTSTLTHIGGLVVGLIGMRYLGMPQQAWLAAVVIVAVLVVASRALTQVATNVNLTHAPWHWEFDLLGTAESYVLSLLAVWAAALWTAQHGLCRLRLVPDGGMTGRPSAVTAAD